MAIARGDRSLPFVDFATAEWTRNEFGIDQLYLSTDPVSGAFTFALRTPPNMQYPERAHFYDCDEDLFQFEGEFHHDQEKPYYEGDYVYRPPGTVYGNSIGSDGGIILASLNRSPVRYHFSENPEPWTGEYLVDRRWNERPVAPMFVHSADVPWTPSNLGDGIDVKALRGTPGEKTPPFGATTHSPWGADSAFILRIPAGYHGQAPNWAESTLEVLAIAGDAVIGGNTWRRGCYSFGRFTGPCTVRKELVLYARCFANLVSD